MNTHSAILPAVVSFLMLAACSSAPAAEPPEIASLRDLWKQARDRTAQPVDAAYVSELQKLLDTLTKAGRLEEALAVKRESQKVVENASAATASNSLDAVTKPAQLVSLRNAWLQSRGRVVAPSDAIYIKELQKLQDVLTKAGKLEAALVVKKELEQMTGGSASATSTKRSNAFVGKNWTTASGSHFEFKADGTGTQTNAAGKAWPLKWTWGATEQIIVDGWSNDQPSTLYFQFTKSKEGVFGANADKLDRQISVK